MLIETCHLVPLSRSSRKSHWTNPVHIFHIPFLQHINIMLLRASLFVVYTSVNMIGTINRDGLDERNM